ncbi:MAG: hypothetical protein ACI97A_003567, partial [Planctomycetota bacterium]
CCFDCDRDVELEPGRAGVPPASSNFSLKAFVLARSREEVKRWLPRMKNAGGTPALPGEVATFLLIRSQALLACRLLRKFSERRAQLLA